MLMSCWGKHKQNLISDCTELLQTKKTEGMLALYRAQHTSINVVDHLSDVCKIVLKVLLYIYVVVNVRA